MPKYIVTYTSMVIEADDEDEAIDRAGDFKGGGEWEATPVADTTACERIRQARELSS